MHVGVREKKRESELDMTGIKKRERKQALDVHAPLHNRRQRKNSQENSILE